MSPDEFDLASLFEPDKEFCTKLSEAAAKSVTEAGGGLARTIAHMRWSAIEEVIHARASELLDQDIADLMAGAWKKYDVLSDLAAETISGEETGLFPLGEHTIHSELHPYLEIQVGSLSYKLVLDVIADIVLKGLVLKIEKGKITSISSGSCQGSGEIQWKEISLLKREFKPVELPGRVQLGAGITVA